MGELSKVIAIRQTPPVPSPHEDYLRHRFFGVLEVDGKILTHLRPTELERRELEVRKSCVLAAMQPGDAKSIRVKIGLLFQRFHQTADLDRSEKFVEACARDVLNMPLWAVDCAIRTIIDNLGDHRFPPTGPQILHACRAAVAPYWVEIEQIRRVLEAPVVPEHSAEERTKMLASLQLLKDKLAEHSRNQRKAEALSGLSELEKRSSDSDLLDIEKRSSTGNLKLSEEALARIGLASSVDEPRANISDPVPQSGI